MDEKKRLLIEITALSKRLKTGEARVSMLIEAMHQCEGPKKGKKPVLNTDPEIENALRELRCAADEVTAAKGGGISMADAKKYFYAFDVVNFLATRNTLTPEMFQNIRLNS